MTQAAIAHPDQATLADFLAGKLSEAESSAIEEHVADCDICRDVFEALPEDTLVGMLRSETSADTLPETAPSKSPTQVGDQHVPPALADHRRYRVVELLGAGGMGAVYKAVHLLMKRTVALKVISPQLTDRPEMVERFAREMQTAARLDHRNIVKSYDAEKAGDLHFLVMEFVAGISLAEKVKREGPLPASLACDYAYQAARGLQHAHELGMIHRDLKPHNLMLTTDGEVKVLDFGLARFVSEVAADSSRTEIEESGSLTVDGELMGTPDFMAPEQASDPHRADIRADIYSLGCTLYFLLAGHPPFPAETREEKLNAHAKTEPKSLDSLRADLPPGLSAVVSRMLAKDPDSRYQSPAEVMEALAPFLPAEKIGATSRGTRRRWAVVAAAIVLAGAAIMLSQVIRPLLDKEQAEFGRLPFSEPPPIPKTPVSAAKRQEDEARRLGVPVQITNSIGMKLRFIPSGTFVMGSPEIERSVPDQQSDEGPQHPVTITKAFYMGANEVTQEQYQTIMSLNPAHFKPGRGGGPDHPVETVRWSDADDFCRKLSERPAERDARRVYRLPTEAEWEYACRAGSTSQFHFGSNPQTMRLYDWCIENAKEKTHPVGQLKPNDFGMYDVHGNVMEWCNDWYGMGYYRISPSSDPTGPGPEIFERGKQMFRIARGGSYYNYAAHCRSAVRSAKLSDHNEVALGFRVVMVEAPPK